jgi:hypothetical protein
MAAMRELEGLPIWIVVRLCTDNDKTVQFWNGLDQDLEVPLEVLGMCVVCCFIFQYVSFPFCSVEGLHDLPKSLLLKLFCSDDFVAEATEVHEHNPWLKYVLFDHWSRLAVPTVSAYTHFLSRPPLLQLLPQLRPAVAPDA